MSRAYYTWQEAVLRSKLEPTTRLVCHTIGCHMAMDGSGCFPSYQTIADESGLHRATVIRHVEKAEEAGYLEVTGRVDAVGDATSNLYRPIMPGVVAQDDHGSRTARPRVVAQRDPNYSTEQPNEKRETRAQRLEPFLETNDHAEWLTWSQSALCWPASKASTVFDTFRDYWKAQPGQKGVKADWEATWRNWCRRETTTFAKPVPLEKGHIRIRETSDDERGDARFYQEWLRQRKLPGNLSKSDDEIAALACAALFGAA